MHTVRHAIALALLAALVACAGDDAPTSESATNPTTNPTTTTTTTTVGPTTSSSTDVTQTGTSASTSSTAGPTTNATDPTTSSTGTTTAGTTTSDTSTAGTTQGIGCQITECGNKLYECGDCEDNDGDGLVDLADPECITPCDDDESTFATGLPGDNMDACKQDCFFDGNSGSGDDKCEWNLKCDPENPGGEDCPYDPDFNMCPDMQDEQCQMNCQVPNGCDCFGCCTVNVDGMDYNVYLGDDDCSIENIGQCESCTINEDCDDECEPEMCELCFGQDPDDLPPECEEPMCDEGDSCIIDNMGGDDCPEGQFCFVGCCETIIE